MSLIIRLRRHMAKSEAKWRSLGVRDSNIKLLQIDSLDIKSSLPKLHLRAPSKRTWILWRAENLTSISDQSTKGSLLLELKPLTFLSILDPTKSTRLWQNAKRSTWISLTKKIRSPRMPLSRSCKRWEISWQRHKRPSKIRTKTICQVTRTPSATFHQTLPWLDFEN